MEPASPSQPHPAAPSQAAPSQAAPSQAAPVPADPETPRLAEREGRRPRDMVMSLLVLIVPIALLMTFYRVVLDGDEPISVDAAPAIQQASKEFPVAQPAGLGDDWHIASATFRRETGGATLRIGYVDRDDDPVLLVQSTVEAATLVPAEVGKEGKRSGTFRDDVRTWMVYDGRPGEIALISTEQKRTIIILGRTDQENLEQLAAALP
ncbi:DUF4245 domain-containing protein [Actinoplanes sp. NPDC051861]|uniref:DUF4245 domain-containing protein n=1 Tax=Actinoplanes sp. NPDC051861 TaxID=3155170 RepID=UPI00342F0E69